MTRIDDGQLPLVVQELATPLADELGAELVDVMVKGQRGRRVVRLVVAPPLPPDAVVTTPDPGLDVDTIATLSRRVGDVLDERDVVAGSYTLEVTSPGVDRPLRQPRDFARNVGRDVRLVRTEQADGPREMTGTVLAVGDQDVTLDVDGDEVSVRMADVDHGKVVLPW